MENELYEKPQRGAHIIILPSPLQGHINPLLQFSKRLASKSLKVTFITTSSLSKQLSSHNNSSSFPSPSLEFIRIFDGFDSEPNYRDDFDAFYKHFRLNVCKSLHALLMHYKTQKSLHPVPKMVIYDAFMPWVLEVVKKSGLDGAPFFTQSCLVNCIYYHAYKGEIGAPKSRSDLYSLPCNERSLLRVDDLPTFVSSPSLYPVELVKMLLDQFSNLDEPFCLFVNTVDMLEFQVVDWMKEKYPVKTIGPCIPSMYLDKRLLNDKDYGLSLFQPQTDSCFQWLNMREPSSVIYISMGSMASLGCEQMDEIAKALERSNKYFLWVVRASEMDKLPLNFKHNKLIKGLIVNWCPQLEVLAHDGIGCFMTHCGWNSTLEAICLGVPMIAFPQWTDQPTNAKCIEDFWKIGVRLKVDEKGFSNANEIEFCIREIMEGESAKEMKNNAGKLKEMAKQAMEQGGSSDENIEAFASNLLSSTL